MQRYLSALDGVTISGQPTCLPISTVQKLYDEIQAGSEAAAANNALLGQPRHHLHLSRAQTVHKLRHFVESVWFDPSAQVVGVKHNDCDPSHGLLCEFWPGARYVACMRHPRTCYESLVATFRPDLSWNEFLNRWCASVEASMGRPNVQTFRIDADGRERLAELRLWLGVQDTPGAQAMIGHPVNDREHLPEPRRFTYTERAAHLMETLQYARTP